MSEWHSEQERRPWEEDKNFPISTNQERFGSGSVPDAWVDHAITKKKDTIKAYEKYLFGTGLYKKY
jgi:hypothetical protein